MKQHQHKFKILWKSQPEFDRPLTQLLYCVECDTKFYGFGGKEGKPEFLHVIKSDSYKKYLYSAVQNTDDNPMWR